MRRSNYSEPCGDADTSSLQSPLNIPNHVPLPAADSLINTWCTVRAGINMNNHRNPDWCSSIRPPTAIKKICEEQFKWWLRNQTNVLTEVAEASIPFSPSL